MKVHESFQTPTEKMNPKSKPFRPRASPEARQNAIPNAEETPVKTSKDPLHSEFSIKNVKEEVKLTPDSSTKEETKSGNNQSKTEDRGVLTPLLSPYNHSNYNSAKKSNYTTSSSKTDIKNIEIKKFSYAEILTVFKSMGNFSGLSVTNEPGSERSVERATPGTLNINRKVQSVLCITKPRYILEHESNSMARMSARSSLVQRSNSSNNLSMNFLHDVDHELKHIGSLNILDEADSDKELDSDEEINI